MKTGIQRRKRMELHKSARKTKVDEFNDEQARIAEVQKLDHVRQLHPTKGFRYISARRFFGRVPT